MFIIVSCLEMMTIATNSDQQKAERGPFEMENPPHAKHPLELSFPSLGPSLL